jgi:transmembrane sensor
MSSTPAKERWWDVAERDGIHAEAAEWLARLQEPTLTLEESLEWRRWMAADERHAHAFARIEDIWERPWDLLGSQKSGATPKSSHVRAWSLAASVGAILVAGTWFLTKITVSSPDAHPAEIVRTTVGENREVKLSDGSIVTLGGRTELSVSMGAQLRRIELIRGEAFFTVAKDPTRPFSVLVGDATVTAIGTEFNIRRNADRTRVAVVEGRVLVEPGTAPPFLTWLRSSTEPVQLGAGQQTTVSEHGAEETSQLVDPATSTSWQKRQLIFREEPLRYAVEDVNRYSAKPIVLDDESIGWIRISGTVLDGNVQGWIKTLESAFELQAVEEPERIVLDVRTATPQR